MTVTEVIEHQAQQSVGRTLWQIGRMPCGPWQRAQRSARREPPPAPCYRLLGTPCCCQMSTARAPWLSQPGSRYMMTNQLDRTRTTGLGDNTGRQGSCSKGSAKGQRGLFGMGGMQSQLCSAMSR